VLWFVVVGASGGLASQIWSVTSDDQLSWLPRSAESTRAVTLEQRFPGADRTQLIVVYERQSGITTADETRAGADAAALAARYKAPNGAPAPPIRSADGKALMVVVSVPEEGVNDTIAEVRDRLGPGGDGLVVKVTGSAAFQYDVNKSLNAIDTTLLLVTVIVVAVILLITYRSPVLWLVPLLVVGLANQLATAVTYALAAWLDLRLNAASVFVITVLVYGAGTDYALLLISRYREELRRHADRHAAMRAALAGAGPAILASATTVTLGLLCLAVADVNSTRSLGPVGAVAIVCALLAMLTLLPAIMVVCGRWLFWPFVPRLGGERRESTGLWARIGAAISRKPRLVWIGATLVLGALALGQLGATIGLPQDKAFRGKPDSVVGQQLLQQHFGGDAGQPATIIARADQAPTVIAAAEQAPGVGAVRTTATNGDLVRLSATIQAEPGSADEREVITGLRARVHAVPGADALVGGPGAQNLDLDTTTTRDERVVIPLVLAAVLLVLIVLLRALVAPVLLVATVVLSFGATLGICSWLFEHVLDFGGRDVTLPLSAFVLLVALGVDYNIFLVTRVREETLRSDTRTGTLAGLATTGGVITSAGVVLAATFGALSVLPTVATVELGIAVAVGVLLDTLLVRSVLVPALILDLNHRVWWPGRLSRRR